MRSIAILLLVSLVGGDAFTNEADAAFRLRRRARFCCSSPLNSPEATFSIYEQAFASGDWRSLFRTLSPSHQRSSLFETLFQIGVRNDRRLQEIQAKYVDESKWDPNFKPRPDAVDPEWEESLAFVETCVTDQERFFTEANLRLAEVGWKWQSPVRLRNVTRKRETAYGDAMLISEDDHFVFFVRIDTQWKIADFEEWRTRRGDKPLPEGMESSE